LLKSSSPQPRIRQVPVAATIDRGVVNVYSTGRITICCYVTGMSMLDAIGETALIRLTRVTAGLTAETPGAWLAGQYDNPANPGAHSRILHCRRSAWPSPPPRRSRAHPRRPPGSPS
jgi:hypothetical protein